MTEKLNNWVFIHSQIMILAVAGSCILGAWQIFAVAAVLSFAWFTVISQTVWQNDYWLGGPANWITWGRLAGSVLLPILAPSASGFLLTAAGLAIITLDALDGYLARRFNTSSLFGEYFDREVDAVFVMALAMAIFSRGQAGVWILALGLIRFVFGILDRYLQSPQDKMPRFNFARIIAGIIMVGLPLAFSLPAWVNRWWLPAMGLLLAYSFGRGLFFNLKMGRS